MLTRPVSSGWRSACRTGVWNSASSSRKSTQWCALEISPGIAKPLPPPMRPAIETPWCGPRKGRAQSSGWSRGSSPRRLRTCVSSSASASSSGGRMPGRQRASMVLPVPGGPLRRRWWPPAAATSSARFASSWPCTSERSCSATTLRSGISLPVRTYALIGSTPSRWLTTAARVGHGITSTPSTSDASAASAAGTKTRAYPRPRRQRVATIAPSTCLTAPSSASSPRNALFGGASLRASARTMATAIGKSSAAPSLRSSAGARLTVKRERG